VINLDTLRATLQANAAPLAAAGAAVVGLLWLVVRLTRRRRSPDAPRIPGRAFENMLTLAAAGIATAVAAVGMWRFFGDVLHIGSVWLRGALFAFLEISLFVSAIRARRNLLDDLELITARRRAAEQAVLDATDDAGRRLATTAVARVSVERASTGVDGVAVWGLAALSGVFAAMDARSFAEAVFRVAAPLVAAWLWERGLAAERRRHRGTSRINWKLTPERVLVKLGMAEPTGRGVGEVDAARRKARLARHAYRLHMLIAARSRPRRIASATRRLQREVEQANEHIGLASDPTVRADVRVHLAVLYQAVTGTAPTAVADLSAWSAAGTAPPTPVPAEIEEARAHQLADQLAQAAMRLIDRSAPAAALTSSAAAATLAPSTGAVERFVSAQRGDESTDPLAISAERRPGWVEEANEALQGRAPRGAVLSERLAAPTRAPAPVSPAPAPHVPVSAALPARAAVPLEASSPPRDSVSVDLPLKLQALELLDRVVGENDPRGPVQLAQLLVDQLGGRLDTAKRYVRDWRTQVDAGQRPHAVAHRPGVGSAVRPPRQGAGAPRRRADRLSR